MDHFRRCSALDTAGLLQPSAKDKQIKGGQSFKMDLEFIVEHLYRVSSVPRTSVSCAES